MGASLTDAVINKHFVAVAVFEAIAWLLLEDSVLLVCDDLLLAV